MYINVGVNDHKIDLFEGQYIVKNGMSYNSYLIKDDKTVVIDTVDVHFAKEWLINIENNLEGRTLNYLVVLHMEPDHSGSLDELFKKYPEVTLVTNMKAYRMINQFFPNLVVNNYLEVKENDVLDLGNIKLQFVFAPMVHWPEVMMAYDLNEKTLFSADAFGKFGALDIKEDWLDEARRYYIGIVGKYGNFVQVLFKKVANLEIKTICPLHGPVLDSNLEYYLNLYNIWSSYKFEEEGTLIVYASIYGNTKKAALELASRLEGTNYEIFDLARSDIHEVIAKAFKYSKLVICSPTYNNGLFPVVNRFIDGLLEREYSNRTLAIMENGSWGPLAKKLIIGKFTNSKNITILDSSVTIKSSLNVDSLKQIDVLAENLK